MLLSNRANNINIPPNSLNDPISSSNSPSIYLKIISDEIMITKGILISISRSAAVWRMSYIWSMSSLIRSVGHMWTWKYVQIKKGLRPLKRFSAPRTVMEWRERCGGGCMRARLGGHPPRIKRSESVGLYRKSALAGEDRGLLMIGGGGVNFFACELGQNKSKNNNQSNRPLHNFSL